MQLKDYPIFTDAELVKNSPKPVVRISVRNLVEFVLRSGDLDSRFRRGQDVEAALAGSRIHRKLQKSETGNYRSEVSVKSISDCGDFYIVVEGRADGVIDGDVPCVDEIKGMYLDVNLLEEPFPVHLAQAKCYAAILCRSSGPSLTGGRKDGIRAAEGGETELPPAGSHPDDSCETGAGETELPRIGVRMTYANLDSGEIRHFHYEYSAEEITAWFAEVVRLYYSWAKWQIEHIRARSLSMKDLPFPFPYREGQRGLTHTVYRSIRSKQDLFLMAPTGVGKTMSCVYPAVRALGEGLGERIFYLTAKNETLKAGREALSILMDRGLDFRVVMITSKEKICPMNEPSCNPDDCPYAKGHFDRVNDAVFELLVKERFYDREVIQKTAFLKNVCPFELSLDLAGWCDAVLCDYNYVFDPTVRLKRFFSAGSKGDAILLVDEAHNLVERGREMYSAAIVKEDVLAAKRAGKNYPKLRKALEKLNKLLLEEKHGCEGEETFQSMGKPVRLLTGESIRPLIAAAARAEEEIHNLFQEGASLSDSREAYTSEEGISSASEEDMPSDLEKGTSGAGESTDALLDFYFQVRDFTRTAEMLDDNYSIYSGFDEDNHFFVRLFCVNPARRLAEVREMVRCEILFSATLLPIGYYRRLLSTDPEVQAVYAESPFEERKRLLITGADVSTRYNERGDEMYRKIAGHISEITSCRTGHYLAFFPSYKMMRDVFRIYRAEFDRPGCNWVLQSPYMQEEDREIFLENFYEDPKDTLIGFCVMGGMFSEGIDLTGTKLIGAIIVGAGIPQVSAEREIIKRHFDEDGSGFDYAYRYPGMNRVQQAAGRVIRTADDLGVIALLDARFMTESYRRLFPREWRRVEVVSVGSAAGVVSEFWREWDRGT